MLTNGEFDSEAAGNESGWSGNAFVFTVNHCWQECEGEHYIFNFCGLKFVLVWDIIMPTIEKLLKHLKLERRKIIYASINNYFVFHRGKCWEDHVGPNIKGKS